MRRTTSSCLVVVALLASAVVSTTAITSAAQEVATVDVAPAAGLVDGDVVTVTGADWPANDSIYFCLGIVTAAAPTPSDCGTTPGNLGSDSTGSFTFTIAVKRWLAITTGQIVDCAQPTAACSLGVTNFVNPARQTVVIPLSFAPQPTEPDPFRITGTVLDPQGQPAPSGVFVNVMTPADTWLAPPSREAFPTGGSFAIEDITPYTAYKIFVSGAYAGLPNEWWVMGVPDQPATRAHAQPITLTTENPTADIVVQLDESGAIAGIVTDAGGEPVGGAIVRGYVATDLWVGRYQAITNDDGTYNLTALPITESVKLRFVPPSGSALVAEWYNDATSRAASPDLMVSAGQTIVANAQLGPAP